MALPVFVGVVWPAVLLKLFNLYVLVTFSLRLRSVPVLGFVGSH